MRRRFWYFSKEVAMGAYCFGKNTRIFTSVIPNDETFLFRTIGVNLRLSINEARPYNGSNYDEQVPFQRN